jgi:starch synthase
MGDPGGFGIRFEQPSVADIRHAVDRAVALYYEQPAQFQQIREQVMRIDHSWYRAATMYLELYSSLK